MNVRFKRFSFASLLFVGGVIAPLGTMALAQDGSLYAPPPPADAAAVRVVSTVESSQPTVLTAGPVKLQATLARPSSYRHVKQGQVALKALGSSSNARFVAGRHYSVIVGAPGKNRIRTYLEPKPSLSKATIVFYNLTSQDGISLKTDDGKITLQENIGAGALVSREVNPLRVGFAVFQGSRKLGTVAPVQLRRGASLGIFLTISGKPRVTTAPGAAVGK
jgi:alginate O-acetyltransferase complex protein AlgF